MATTLIKLNGTSGDLKEMTTAEEAYIAYQVSAFLASASWTNTSVGTIINSTTTTHQPVGVYNNTYYNQAVGTHPGTSLSIGTTSTTLKQSTGVFSETGLTYPISWEGTLDGIKQMTSAELDTICDRILAYIMTNEWPGSLRIATSVPTGYSLFRSGIFSDTRADGTSIAYNLYKKTTMPTQPTVVRPVRLEGTDGNLKEMTDAEIQATFGRRVVNRMISANNRTGRYFLGTTAPTSNGYTGTWVTRGTATDTRNVTSEVDYTRTSINNSTTAFAGNYTTTFSGNYTRTSSVTFTGTYAGINYTRTSTRTSTRYSVGPAYYTSYGTFNPTYLGNFAGNYVGDFIIRYTGQYASYYTGDFVGDYIHDYIGNYTHDYIGNYLGNYVGTTLSSSSSTVATYTLYVRTA